MNGTDCTSGYPPSPTTCTSTPPPPTAETGADLSAPIAGGAGLLLIGALAIAVAFRRKGHA